MADQTITPEVREILENGCFVEEGTVFKIDRQLQPDLYGKVDLILKLLGGKWNKSAGGHVFPRDSKEMLAAALDTGTAPDMKKRRQAYYTPAAVAVALVEECWLEGKLVLEPSAGGGSLATVCQERGATVDCIESDPFECANLHALGFDVRKADFLTVEPEAKYDMVVMNPPFTKGQDEKHVRHALKFLKPGGKLVAIVSPSFKLKTLREFAAEYGMNRIEFDEIEAGAFKESGTGIATRRLTIRTFGDISEPHNADQVEWRGHQLAIEVIHGAYGRETEEARGNAKRMREAIHRGVERAAADKYRDKADSIINLVVDDKLLEKIKHAAVLECLSYHDIESEAPQKNPEETPDNPEPPEVAKPTSVHVKLEQPFLFDVEEQTIAH